MIEQQPDRHVVDVRIEAVCHGIRPDFVETVVRGALSIEVGNADPVEVSVLVTSDIQTRELNRRYRGIDRPTDVLSFALENDPAGEQARLPFPRALGDVVVSCERARAQADEHGHPLDRELGWLLVHGVLQLLGYRHDEPEDAERMRVTEELVLRSVGLSRPAAP